jgi:LacI family transcriptional regulator
LEVIETLDYQPSAFARGLATQKTYTIGFVIPTISDPFYLSIVRGVEEGAASEQYSLLIVSQPFALSTQRILELFTQRRVDGMVIVGITVPSKAMKRLHTLGFPLVLLQGSSEGTATFAVDNYGGAVAVTEHLLSLGHKRIAYIAGSNDTPDNSARFRGFQDTLCRAGLKFDVQLFAQGDYSQGSGSLATEALLKREIPVDAIFAANDQMAMDAILALRRRAMRVPNDMAVVGFDDIPLASYVVPPLTTVRQPGYELGFGAAKAVLAALRGEVLPKETTLPVELVVRESCGALLRKGG